METPNNVLSYPLKDRLISGLFVQVLGDKIIDFYNERDSRRPSESKLVFPYFISKCSDKPDILTNSDGSASIFFEQITAYNFIDCFRDKIRNELRQENKDIIEGLDYLSKVIYDDKGWEISSDGRNESCTQNDISHKDYISVIVFLLAVSRDHVISSGLENIRNLGKDFHKYCVDKDRDDYFRKAGLLSGVFIWDFNMSEDEKYRILKFEFDNTAYMYDIIMNFYSDTDMGVFYERAKTRYSKRYDGRLIDYNTYGSLYPAFLHLPPPVHGRDAMITAVKLSDAIEDSNELAVVKINEKELAQKMRILQWEILTRDLVKEGLGGDVHYVPYMSNTGDMKSFITDEYLTEIARGSWEYQYSYLQSSPGVFRKREGYNNKIDVIDYPLSNIEGKLKHSRFLFTNIIKNLKIHYREAYIDVLDHISNMDRFVQSERNNEWVTDNLHHRHILIEDGEFTFFCLLWFFRKAVDESKDIRSVKDWMSSKKKLQMGLDCLNIIEEWWNDIGFDEFIYYCGIALKVSDNSCFVTQRWYSLINWLKINTVTIKEALRNHSSQFYNILIEKNIEVKDIKLVIGEQVGVRIIIGDDSHQDVIISDIKRFLYDSKAPVKILSFLDSDQFNAAGNGDIYWCEIVYFIIGILKFFSDSSVNDFLKKCVEFPNSFLGTMEITRFSELMMLLLDYMERSGVLNDYHKNNDSLEYKRSRRGERDIVLFRLCRSVFIAAECILRSYQPYELHVLVLALSYSRKGGKAYPGTLSFATIAGSIPSYVYHRQEYQEHRKRHSIFHQWLVRYWTLFSSLSSDLSLDKMQVSAKEKGWIDGTNRLLKDFSHEMKTIAENIAFRLQPITEVFHLNDIPQTGDEWPEEAGILKVEKGKEDYVKNWLVVPQPELVHVLLNILQSWNGSRSWKNRIGLEGNVPLDNVIRILFKMAKKMNIAEHELQESPLSFEDVVEQDERVREAVNKYFDIEIKCHENKTFLWRQNVESNPATTDFICLIIASLRNSMKHMMHNKDRDKKNIIINIEATKANDGVRFSIENEMTAYNEQEEEEKILAKRDANIDGTKTVLDSCIKRLGGTLELFDSNKSQTDWLTIFTLPYESEYSGEKIIWLSGS